MKNDFQIRFRRARGLRFVAARFMNVFIVALVCAFAHTAAYSAGLGRSSKPHHAFPAQWTVTINLRDYGAVGDGLADDGPALQSALNALANAGDGKLCVPDGRYALATPVVVDFSGRAASAIIQGTPSSAPDGGADDYGRGLNLTAEFLIKTGENANAITLKNLSTLSIEDLVFIGDPEARNDAKVVLHLSNIDDATIRRCEFYGLSSLVADGAIVYAQGSDLKISDSAFLGCAGNSGTYTSIVQVYEWKGISVIGTRFVDYGTRPNFYSKTPLMSPFAWVSVGGAAALTNLSPRRDVIIKDVLFDEGAYHALTVDPDFFPVSDGGAISLVFISKLYVNVTNLGEVGLSINRADNVFIENS